MSPLHLSQLKTDEMSTPDCDFGPPQDDIFASENTNRNASLSLDVMDLLNPPIAQNNFVPCGSLGGKTSSKFNAEHHENKEITYSGDSFFLPHVLMSHDLMNQHLLSCDLGFTLSPDVDPQNTKDFFEDPVLNDIMNKSCISISVEEQPFTTVNSADTGDEIKPDVVNNIYQASTNPLQSQTFDAQDISQSSLVQVTDYATIGQVNDLLALFPVDPSLCQSSSFLPGIENAVETKNLPTSTEVSLPVVPLNDDQIPTTVGATELAPAETTTVDFIRTGRKRKAPSSIEDAEEWHEGENPGYQEKRRRNNEAVRKSRAKAKNRQKICETEVGRLKEDNEKLSRKVELLERECSLLKELFGKIGINLPNRN